MFEVVYSIHKQIPKLLLEFARQLILFLNMVLWQVKGFCGLTRAIVLETKGTIPDKNVNCFPILGAGPVLIDIQHIE